MQFQAVRDTFVTVVKRQPQLCPKVGPAESNAKSEGFANHCKAPEVFVDAVQEWITPTQGKKTTKSQVNPRKQNQS